jgi:thioredoxin-dependent peroxiredoxin
MKRAAIMTGLALLAATPAFAALKPGAKAPEFTAQAAMAGKTFNFTLSQALKKGPVVLFFYPKAFTSGCSMEANQFAEAMPEFRKAGATVIGMSADDIATLSRFSVEECKSNFPVASAPLGLIRAYDAELPLAKMSNRTSYVIASDGTIRFVHSDMKAQGHVAKILAAVRALKSR